MSDPKNDGAKATLEVVLDHPELADAVLEYVQRREGSFLTCANIRIEFTPDPMAGNKVDATGEPLLFPRAVVRGYYRIPKAQP